MLALTQNFSTAQIGAAILIGLSPYVLQFVYRLFNSVVESHRHPREIVKWFWAAYSIGVLLSAGLAPWWITTGALAYPLIIFGIHGVEVKPPASPTTPTSSKGGLPYKQWMAVKHADTELSAYAHAIRKLDPELEALADSETEQQEELRRQLAQIVSDARERHDAIQKVLNAWQPIRAIVGLGVTFIFAASIFSPQPWLPLEKLTAAGRTSVGYVLGEDGKWTKMLEDDTRLIKTFESDSIADRQFCAKSNSGRGRTIIELLAKEDPAEYEKC